MGFIEIFKKKTTKSSSVRYDSEAAVRLALWDLLIYLFFLIVATIVATSARHLYMFYFNKTIDEVFLKRSYYNEMVTTRDWWFFVEDTFTEQMYSDESEDRIFLRENMLLGPPRLRQIRVRENTCEVNPVFVKYFKNCYAEYSTSNEDTSPEYKGTYFYTKDEIRAVTLWAKIGDYEGAGYIQSFTYNKNTTLKIIEQLKKKQWIDRGTRVVILEFVLYNANTDLLDNVKFIVEMPPTGGIIPSAQLQALKLHTFWTERNYFVFVCAIIFYLMVVYYTIQEVREMRRTTMRRYFCSMWNILDCVILILAYLSFIYNIWHPLYMERLMTRVRVAPSQYHSLDVICLCNMLYLDMMAICVFCVWIKVFKFISFNKTLLRFSLTMRRCAKDLFGFGVMFLIVFLAYAQLGFLLFGNKHHDFRNFKESFLTMMRMMLGDFEYSAMEDAHRLLGPIYFLSYILLVFFILLNMFLAIINDTYSIVKNEIKFGDNHLQVFIVKRLRKCCKFFRQHKWAYGTGKERESNKYEGGDDSPTENIYEIPQEVTSSPTIYPHSYNTSTNPTETLRVRRSLILSEYFEEVDELPQQNSEQLKRVIKRVETLEGVLEQLIENMDRILSKVEAKKRTKGD